MPIQKPKLFEKGDDYTAHGAEYTTYGIDMRYNKRGMLDGRHHQIIEVYKHEHLRDHIIELLNDYYTAESELELEVLRNLRDFARRLRQTAFVDDDFPKVMHDFDMILKQALSFEKK